MKLAWQFAGFVDRDNRQMTLHVEFDGHATFENLTLTLALNPALNISAPGGQIAATRPDASHIEVNW